MIKAVIFDYGGVIERGLKRFPIRKIARAYGLPKQEVLLTMRPALSLFRRGLISEKQFWKQASSLSIGRPIPQNALHLFSDGQKKSFYVYPTMVKLISKLKQSGIKTAVLSNVIKPHALITISHGGYRYFDHVILSYKVHLEKPNPDIYHLATKKLEVKPQECIFVDDLERNLVTARKLKMKTVLCSGPRKTIRAINQLLNNR